jgi:uncharacterized protein YuzE
MDMKVTYHPKHNVAYIALRDKPDQVETVRLSDEINVDLAPDGSVYGIELLNASRQLTADGGQLIVINQQSGQSSQLKLAI